MTRLLAAVSALALSAGLIVPAAAQEVPQETVDAIVAMLAEMQCEMDPSNIEPDDGGYELDDVFCADGQYDIDIDADLKVTNKRKE